MQQLFYMTNDGRLKDPRSSTEYEANAWPGRIVAVCPRQPDETVDEFRYLAIVELLAIADCCAHDKRVHPHDASAVEHLRRSSGGRPRGEQRH